MTSFGASEEDIFAWKTLSDAMSQNYSNLPGRFELPDSQNHSTFQVKITKVFKNFLDENFGFDVLRKHNLNQYGFLIKSTSDFDSVIFFEDIEETEPEQ